MVAPGANLPELVPDRSPGRAIRVREPLLAWFAVNGRDLPWRRTRDPWAVLVSEAMLQQTQVARVLPRFESFVARFATPAACAAAPVADVVRAWAGLGYNRRAVNLHRTAAAVVARHGGRLPADLTVLMDLPGLGPYTARAVLAFAFEADVAVVETNTARVLARTAGRRLPPAVAQARADALVPPGRSWAWNQAMVDLGATVCTRREPHCGSCPLAGACGWRAAGAVPDPAAPPSRQSAFAGSDRQGRGRLVDALVRSGAIPPESLAACAGWPDDPERARRAAASLVADGLAVDVDGHLRLP